MTAEDSAARVAALGSSLEFHESCLGKFEHDLEMYQHIQVLIHNAKACIHAERVEPDDDFRYYLEAHRWAAENGDLQDDDVCGKRVRTRTFEDRRYFTPQTAAVLEALQAAYGDALYVYTQTYTPPTGRDGVAKDARFIWKVIALHEDFMPSKSALEYRGSKDRHLRRPYAVFTGRDHPFCIADSDNYHNLVTTVRYRSTRNIKVDAALEGALGDVVTSPDGVHSIPTWTATTVDDGGMEYVACPTFGPAVGIDAEMLLTDGVVVDLEGLGRHKVWFNYTLYLNEDGWPGQRPSGERALRVQRTDESLTEPKERSGCRMRGQGSSQQGTEIVPFKGRAPHCLMVLHVNDVDYTFTVMVDVEGGSIVRAWVEGSCT
jgi:hypothetical protein